MRLPHETTFHLAHHLDEIARNAGFGANTETTQEFDSATLLGAPSQPIAKNYHISYLRATVHHVESVYLQNLLILLLSFSAPHNLPYPRPLITPIPKPLYRKGSGNRYPRGVWRYGRCSGMRGTRNSKSPQSYGEVVGSGGSCFKS